MAFKTLSQLRVLVRQWADIENDGNHITDDEVDSRINASAAFLHSMLTDGTNGSLFAKNAGVLVKLGDNSYQLPGDFSQLVDVSVKTGVTYVSSEEADPQDYAALAVLRSNTRYTRHYLQWNVDQGRGELFMFPTPTNVSDIAVRYVPEFPILSLDADTFNLPSFLYMWVVLDAAIACAIKDESPAGGLAAERDRYERRLRDHIKSMSISTVRTIRSKRNGTLTPPDIHTGS